LSNNYSYEWRKNNCNQCSAWMFNEKSSVLQYEPGYKLPVQFYHLQGNKLTLNYIKFSDNIVVMDYIHVSIMSRKSNKKEAEDIMKTFCFSQELQDRVIKSAERCRSLKEIDEPTSAINNEDNEAIWDDYAENKALYRKCDVPRVWRYFDDPSLFPETPMHLLGLGIIKTCMNDFMDVLKHKNAYTIFFRLSKNILLGIQQLNVSWCKILTWEEGKLGGWISENYLGYARIVDWHLSLVNNLDEIMENIYKEPITHYSKWTGKMCKDWLESRGIKGKGKALELKNEVTKIMEGNLIPTVVAKKNISFGVVVEMMHLLNQLISCCMQEEVVEKNIVDIEMIIRMFLIKYDEVDSVFKTGKKQTPGWVTSYNFMSLLNIPNMMKEYGSLRNIWEGGECGEGFLRKVKPEIKYGLRQQWKVWLMNNILKNMCYDLIIEEINIEEERKLSLGNLEWKVYSNKAMAKVVFQNNIPISGMCYYDGNINKYYTCHRSKGMMMGWEIKVTEKSCVKNYLNYRLLEHSNTTLEITANLIQEMHGVIFLPQLGQTGYPNYNLEINTLYCVIHSNWSTIWDSKL